MKKITRWSPDTCDCVLEYEWDNELSGADRVHTPTNIVKYCEAHSLVRDKVQHYNFVHEENSRKNNFYSLFNEHLNHGFEESAKKREFKAGFGWAWRFDENRKFIATLTGFNNADKAKLRGLAQVRFGSDKVDVE